MNINQTLVINSSSTIIFMEKLQINQLPNKIIQLNSNAQIRIPSTFQLNITDSSTVFIRVKDLFIEKKKEKRELRFYL